MTAVIITDTLELSFQHNFTRVQDLHINMFQSCAYQSCTPLARFTLKYFFLYALLNCTVFVFNFPLVAHEQRCHEFFVVYSSILPNSLSSRNFYLIQLYSEFSEWVAMPCVNIQFDFSLYNHRTCCLLTFLFANPFGAI